MGRAKAELPTGARAADYLAVGFLAWNCPLEKVRAALAAHGIIGATARRQRGGISA
jgi:hypothetical protein